MSTPLYVVENIKACHACIRGTGRTACPEDGGDIGTHAEEADCPLGLHIASDGSLPPKALRDLNIPLPGDVVETIAKRIGADRLAKLWERWTGMPCGCAERKEKMNRAARRLARWMGYSLNE